MLTLLAVIFVVVSYVQESYKSDALYIAFIITLSALAFVGFRSARKEQ